MKKDKDHEDVKKEAYLTVFAFVEVLDPENFDWSPEELETVGDIRAMGDVIIKRLENAGNQVINGYAILHDKDEHKLWESYAHNYVTCDVENHAHFLFKFREGICTLEELASIVGIKAEQIEKPKAGRYAWDNLLSYLIHIKYRDMGKYVYDASDVVTLAGEQYEDIYLRRMQSWEHAHAIMRNKKANYDLTALMTSMEERRTTLNQLIEESRDNPDLDFTIIHNFQKLKRKQADIDEIDAIRQENEEERSTEELRQKLLNDFADWFWGDDGEYMDYMREVEESDIYPSHRNLDFVPADENEFFDKMQTDSDFAEQEIEDAYKHYFEYNDDSEYQVFNTGWVDTTFSYDEVLNALNDGIKDENSQE